MRKKELLSRIDEAVEDVRDDFHTNPASFLVEATVQDALVTELNKKFEGKTSIKTDVDLEETAEYKEEYIKALDQADGNKMDRVKREVNVGEGQGEKDHLFDICIFDEDSVTITIEGGSKYFKHGDEDIRAAIEVKYVKNDNLPSTSWENPEQRDKADNPPSPPDAGDLKPDEDGERDRDESDQFFNDIAKLIQSDADVKYLVVFSNKNIFQQPVGEGRVLDRDNAVDDNSQGKAIRRLDNLLDTLEDAGIEFREVHIDPNNQKQTHFSKILQRYKLWVTQLLSNLRS